MIWMRLTVQRTNLKENQGVESPNGKNSFTSFNGIIVVALLEGLPQALIKTRRQ
jgi:hypothetical protein